MFVITYTYVGKDFVTIYGKLGLRVYRNSTLRDAKRLYKAEWKTDRDFYA